ncbi:MAG: ornithine cyclodeaminase family protein, partial [Polyangiaceae bacterium]|nr:ornithine cyclodeaminase family protein [Polyangiaceae bacterium]
MNTLVLTRNDLSVIVQAFGRDALMDEVLAQLRIALREYDPSRTQSLRRQGFVYEKPRLGVLEWMPVMRVSRQVVIKVVAYNPGNPDDVGLPTIVSTISVYDPATGHLVALLDGILLTALRTGAASAVATQILARPGSSIVGIIGCGAQAVTQLHALSRVMQIQEVLFFDTDPSAVASFPRRTAFLGLSM